MSALFRALARAKLQLGQFEARALANTAWAFATAGQAEEKLFATVAVAVGQQMRAEFKAQDLITGTFKPRKTRPY